MRMVLQTRISCLTVLLSCGAVVEGLAEEMLPQKYFEIYVNTQETMENSYRKNQITLFCDLAIVLPAPSLRNHAPDLKKVVKIFCMGHGRVPRLSKIPITISLERFQRKCTRNANKLSPQTSTIRFRASIERCNRKTTLCASVLCHSWHQSSISYPVNRILYEPLVLSDHRSIHR